MTLMPEDSDVMSSPLPSVFVRWWVASLPPTCPRTRPEDAKTRRSRPGFSARNPCK